MTRVHIGSNAGLQSAISIRTMIFEVIIITGYSHFFESEAHWNSPFFFSGTKKILLSEKQRIFIGKSEFWRDK